MGRSYVEWQNNQTPFSSFAAQSTMVRNCDLVENNPAQLGCIAFQAGLSSLAGDFPGSGPELSAGGGSPRMDRAVVMISYGLWKGHLRRRSSHPGSG